MQRFHVHVSVRDLEQSIRFYSGLFATAPTVRKQDYAKWMLENPRVSFAISERDRAIGTTHLGIQAESPEELSQVYQQLKSVEQPLLEQPGASCCYARGDKNWVTDPQGIAWKTFFAYAELKTFGGDTSD